MKIVAPTQRRLRLVHLTTSPLSLRFLSAQIDYMRARGYEVHCITSPGEGDALPAFAEDVHVHRIPMSRSMSPVRDLVSVIRLWRALRHLKPEVLQLHMSKAGLLGSLAGRLARVPICLYDNQGSAFFSQGGLRGWLVKSAERLTCSIVDGVQSASHSVRERFVTEGVCHPDRIKVLASGSYGVEAVGRFSPAALDATEVWALRARLEIPPTAPVVGFVGRLIRLKGIPELLTAWRQLSAEFPAARLLLVGSPDPREALPPEVLTSLRDVSIVSVGWVDDPRPYYALMDVLTLPSLHEGLPICLLEAAAMGVPAVATQIPGNVDAVLDGVTGTLVPVRDAGALAQALGGYLRDPELAKEQGRAARERVLREFLPEPICAAFYQTYERLLRERGLAGRVAGG